MKLFGSLMLLVCAPLALAANGGGYPTEGVAEFVAEKLDVTTLPAAVGPKHEKGKKTFGDYGFVIRKAEGSESLIESANGGARYSVKVLGHSDSGIYVCFAQESQEGNAASFQRVLLLKRNHPNDLLKGREAFREFNGCPAIGGAEESSSYGG